MLPLRELRKRAGYTQAGLAARSGLRQATISALENGHSGPHPGTILALAAALGEDVDAIRLALSRSAGSASLVEKAGVIEQAGSDWPLLAGLDRDLRTGLARALVVEWTHSSTAIEGNTISAGDTLFVLTEGLTVSGKSLREHQEIHGHAQALGLMAAWTRVRQPVRVSHLHQLHRAVQTGAVVDCFAPVGAWKVEPNGTTAITTGGTARWHEYASPRNVPGLVAAWLKSLVRICGNPLLKAGTGRDEARTREFLLDAYTDLHLGFVGIHPYADGNGRMARLLANVPVLRAGQPPLLVSAAGRREYLALLGDYSLRRGQPAPGEDLVLSGPEWQALRTFFAGQWRKSQQLVAKFHRRQQNR